MTTYLKKLKDPRWQKMRLKVLERDNWKCCRCLNTKTTLHVHHNYYEKNKDPWKYPIEAFTTLCETCHKIVEEEKQKEKIEGAIVLQEMDEQSDYDFETEIDPAIMWATSHVFYGLMLQPLTNLRLKFGEFTLFDRVMIDYLKEKNEKEQTH